MIARDTQGNAVGHTAVISESIDTTIARLTASTRTEILTATSPAYGQTDAQAFQASLWSLALMS